MATNTDKNHRDGSVKDRTQTRTGEGNWVKRDRETGEFMDVKEDGTPFKGVAKEKDERRS